MIVDKCHRQPIYRVESGEAQLCADHIGKLLASICLTPWTWNLFHVVLFIRSILCKLVFLDQSSLAILWVIGSGAVGLVLGEKLAYQQGIHFGIRYWAFLGLTNACPPKPTLPTPLSLSKVLHGQGGKKTLSARSLGWGEHGLAQLSWLGQGLALGDP